MKNNLTRVFVAGHKGMVGSALIRILKNKNIEIITKEKFNLNLLNQNEVENFFLNQKIDQVYIAAAKVGGIYANQTYPADFIYENLTIQTNIIHSSFLGGVKKLLFLGSSCIYPKDADQPITENALLTGKLEPTNEPYALAKITGIKMCESYNRQFGESHNLDYRCIMPTNLYGPGDNYDPNESHVIPGLIYKFHKAKVNNLQNVTIWGTGTPKREFLHVDDLARASLLIMNLDKKSYKEETIDNNFINVGSGKDITIKELANIIKQVVGFRGNVLFDKSKPDGTLRKLLNISKIEKFGFKPEINLFEGLTNTYNHYSNTLKNNIKT